VFASIGSLDLQGVADKHQQQCGPVKKGYGLCLIVLAQHV
jgi:hypothetical protein